MWVTTRLIAVGVMNAMGRDPVDGSALEGKRGANDQEILNRLGNSVTPVREQAVIGHTDAETLSYPGKNGGHNQALAKSMK